MILVLRKIKDFFKDHIIAVKDFIFISIVLFLIFRNLLDIKFIYLSNILNLELILLIIIIFLWMGIRLKFDKSHLISSASIIIAVFTFLLSRASADDSKIKLLSGISDYNCYVAQNILTFKEKDNLSNNFSLLYFITQPYFDNIDFIFSRLSTSTATSLLNSAYGSQSANALISQVQGLNIQGASPLFGPFIGQPLEMYNKQLIEIASSTEPFFCENLFQW